MCGFWVALHDHWGIPKYRCSIMFSLCIITIFYHPRTIRVNQRNHIALQIVDFYHSAYKRLYMPFRGIKWSSLFWQKKKRPSISRKSLSWSRWQDLNLRPFGPEPNALPNCATPRKYGANEGTRTLDLRFTKPLLYRLSHIGVSHHHASAWQE